MREDFLHYLWRLARFDLNNLLTTEGESIFIEHFGFHNVNAGPDFSHARLRIGNVQWAGNVEIHVKSSQWYDHNHQNNPHYESVILHVVLEEDRPVYRSNGSRIPCLELRGRIPSGLIRTYWRLQHNENWIPCANQLHSVSSLTINHWLERIMIERLERRTTQLEGLLKAVNRDWEALFYQSLARSLGGQVNAEGMEILARALPLQILLRYSDNLLQTEALLFGQAGLIPEESDEVYPQKLKQTYQVLAVKHQLKALPKTIWRHLRLRPANFPELRIAQLARLLTTTGHLFSKALAANSPKELENMFDVHLSNYWRDHYLFGRKSKRSMKRLGRASIQKILLNTVAPMLYLYGQLRQEPQLQERAIDILHSLPAENNLVLRNWAKHGIVAETAGTGQALLELKKHYCKQRRCLECAIGCAILGRNNGPDPVMTVNEEAILYALTGS